MELINIISKMLGKTIVSTDSTSTQLHGGTVGNVVLYEGAAKTSDNGCLPFKIVCKVSGKWERYGDPDSWRREYDLYTSGLETLFTDEFQWPKCYHAELNDDKIQLWLEYLVEWFLDAETPEEKEYHIKTLQKIYEIQLIV